MAMKSNAAKTRGMSGDKSRKARGRTNITGTGGNLGPKKTNPMSPQEQRRDATRPVSAGAGKHRGDRRDMNKLYTGNAKHRSRGSDPRPDVSTRKR